MAQGLVAVVLCFIVAFLDQLCQQTLSLLSLGGWAGVALRALGYGCLFASVVVLLGRFGKWLFCCVATIMMVIITAEFFVRFKFGWNFHGDWLMLVQATSANEIWLFVRENWISMLGCLCGLLFLLMFSLRIIRMWRPKGWSAVGVAVSLVLLVPFALIDFQVCRPLKSFNNLICFRVVKDTLANAEIFAEMGKTVSNPELPDVIATSVPQGDLPICVIIIGESMTRNNMRIYGYERDTTPCLDAVKSELSIFKDIVGVWNQTPMAVRYLFTAATYEDQTHSRYALAQVAKRAGYETAFFSRQSRWGALNNMITYAFDACDKKVFLDETMPGPIYDIDLLPYFYRQLDEAGDRSQVIFLHLYGCHYPYGYFTPESDKVFHSEQSRVDDYDAAVRHDDMLIGKLISRIRLLSRPSALFYVSDHGESPRSRSWRDMSSPDMWELPAFAWFSEQYKANFPETVSRIENELGLPLQSDQLLPVMMDILQVREKSLALRVKCRKVRYIHMWQKKYE